MTPKEIELGMRNELRFLCSHPNCRNDFFDLNAGSGLRNNRVIDYASVCRSKRDLTPFGLSHFMQWPRHAATVCILNSFNSLNVWLGADANLSGDYRNLQKDECF